MSNIANITTDPVFAELEALERYQAIPDEMRQQDRWLVYRLAPKKDGTDKHPYNPLTGKKSNDPKLGVPYNTAVQVSVGQQIGTVTPTLYDGVGFYVEPPYIVIDIDKCVTAGQIEPFAMEVVRQLDTYAELSPSGTGVHIWVKGEKPGATCRKGIEIYATRRFMTMTGRQIDGTPNRISERNITDVYNRMLRGDFIDPTNKADTEPASGLTVSNKLETLMHGNYTPGSKPFRIDYQGGVPLEYPSQSEADQALCNLLALQGDAAFIDAEFRKSVLMRDKWEERNHAAYSKNTIENAVKWASKVKAGKIEPFGSTLTTRRGDQIRTRAIVWLWDGIIPLGKLSNFSGNPGEGKSLVTVYVTAMVTTGQTLFGSNTPLEPSEVLLLCGEDEPDDTVIPRLQAAGADLSKVHFVDSVVLKDGKGKTLSEREAQLDTDIVIIEETLKNNPKINLVIIDPISNYLGKANMNREQEVRQVLSPLKALAARRGIAILYVMHLNKSADASAICRTGGAMAFNGISRSSWLFIEDSTDLDKERHFMLRVKNNITKRRGGLVYKIGTRLVTVEGRGTAQPVVEWVGTTETTADNALQSGNKQMGRPAKEKTSAVEWLREFLRDGPQMASDVKYSGKRADHQWRTLNNAKRDLGVTSTRVKAEDGVGGGWEWQLPDHRTPETTISL